jgi:type 1 glutamine amidotransferase
VEIAHPEHPITAGLSAWEMVDETYVMAEPDADNDILLTVDHPRSTVAIAWSRTFRQAPVFCFQSGHDNKTYANPHFRRIVERGIQWCAGRL